MEADNLIDILIVIVIAVALIPVILTSLNGLNWATLNIGGTVYNFSWVPYLLILGILIGLAVIGIRFYKGHKK